MPALNCPSCGASVSAPDGRAFVFCGDCGQKVLIPMAPSEPIPSPADNPNIPEATNGQPKEKKKMGKGAKIGIVVAIAVVVIIAAIAAVYFIGAPSRAYNAGVDALNDGDSVAAQAYFQEAGNYRDAEVYLHCADYLRDLHDGNYGTLENHLIAAIDAAGDLDATQDSTKLAMFLYGDYEFIQGNYGNARHWYDQLDMRYAFQGYTVYERLATIELAGVWKMTEWYGTDADGNRGVTKSGSELENWGHYHDGSFFALSGCLFAFDDEGEYVTTEICLTGVNGDGAGTWVVDTRDISDDGTFKYVLDQGGGDLESYMEISNGRLHMSWSDGEQWTFDKIENY